MKPPIFITGIGTGIGKTLASAIIAEALEADYWKPVQAGTEPITDSEWVRKQLTNPKSVVHPERYTLKLAASPHFAAQKENIAITVQNICASLPDYSCNLVIEGAGGLMVPLNDTEFIKDLILSLGCRVVLVSRNYIGSINHSLLTAAECKRNNIPVLGWVFIGYEPIYEQQIASWSKLPIIASVPLTEAPENSFVKLMAEYLRDSLTHFLC
ncbi:MAG: dethiobiotin synthase [Chitinophagaceae bacterium]